MVRKISSIYSFMVVYQQGVIAYRIEAVLPMERYKFVIIGYESFVTREQRIYNIADIDEKVAADPNFYPALTLISDCNIYAGSICLMCLTPYEVRNNRCQSSCGYMNCAPQWSNPTFILTFIYFAMMEKYLTKPKYSRWKAWYLYQFITTDINEFGNFVSWWVFKYIKSSIFLI